MVLPVLLWHSLRSIIHVRVKQLNMLNDSLLERVKMLREVLGASIMPTGLFSVDEVWPMRLLLKYEK